MPISKGEVTMPSEQKIIVISEDFKRNIMAKGVPEEKIERTALPDRPADRAVRAGSLQAI